MHPKCMQYLCAISLPCRTLGIYETTGNEVIADNLSTAPGGAVPFRNIITLSLGCCQGAHHHFRLQILSLLHFLPPFITSPQESLHRRNKLKQCNLFKVLKVVPFDDCSRLSNGPRFIILVLQSIQQVWLDFPLCRPVEP